MARSKKLPAGRRDFLKSVVAGAATLAATPAEALPSQPVEEHSTDRGPKNPRETPGRKERAIVRAGVPRAPKIRDGRGNDRGLRSVAEIHEVDQHIQRGEMSANPVKRGHGDAGNCQYNSQRI